MEIVMGIGESVHSGEKNSSFNNTPNSLTLGIVKKNWDVKHPGMVQVSISTPVDDDLESDWMPVMSPYAAKGCGFYLMPEVGSTVIIGYIDDNSASPVVIGSIWSENGKSSSKLPNNTANKDNSIKVMSTTGGHMIKFDEGKDTPSIEIISAKKQSIKIDDKNNIISVKSKESDAEVTMNGKDGKISIKASKAIELNIGEKKLISLEKNGININSDNIKINGKSLEIKGNQTKISGSTLEIKAQGNLKVESSGMAQIKGSILKLN